MSILLYDNNESVCCQKVRIALEEKGWSYKLKHISFESRDQYKKDFLKLNPKHKVPVLVHDGLVITESIVINQYIDEVFDGPRLIPTGPYDRARQRIWSRAIDHLHYPALTVVSFTIAFRHGMRGYGSNPDEDNYYEGKSRQASTDAIREPIVLDFDSPRFIKSVYEFNDLLNNMESVLNGSKWLAGNEISLADIDVVPYVWRLKTLQLGGMMSNLPRVQDWCQRMFERESCKVGMINAHIPEWLEKMERYGKSAWPVVENLLADKN
jgi:glutathione S-transferase